MWKDEKRKGMERKKERIIKEGRKEGKEVESRMRERASERRQRCREEERGRGRSDPRDKTSCNYVCRTLLPKAPDE